MDIKSMVLDRVTLVELHGEIDAKTVVRTQEQLMPLVQPGIKLLFDMHDVTYMSSSGLRMLLTLYREVSASNGTIALANVSDEITDTMEVTGFLRYFTIYLTLDQGLADLQ